MTLAWPCWSRCSAAAAPLKVLQDSDWATAGPKKQQKAQAFLAISRASALQKGSGILGHLHIHMGQEYSQLKWNFGTPF